MDELSPCWNASCLTSLGSNLVNTPAEGKELHAEEPSCWGSSWGFTFSIMDLFDILPLYDAALSLVQLTVASLWTSMFVPWGEALNPGPFAITCVNPTGVRGKEQLLFDLPHGITCVCETHLASSGMAAACGRLRHMSRQSQRSLHVLPGAPVPLRARSQVTGIWSGVMQISDMPSHRVQLHWPQDEFRLGIGFRLPVFELVIYPSRGRSFTVGARVPLGLVQRRPLVNYCSISLVRSSGVPVDFASSVGTSMAILQSSLNLRNGFKVVGRKCRRYTTH